MTRTNDVQLRFQNWNWKRISRIFWDGGIGIGIELRLKLQKRIGIGIELEAKITRRNWNRNLSIPATCVNMWMRVKMISLESELESKFHGIGIGIELNKYYKGWNRNRNGIEPIFSKVELESELN